MPFIPLEPQAADAPGATTGRPLQQQSEHHRMLELLRRFPQRLTPHLRELMRRSPAVALQFRADVRELYDNTGDLHCFSGLLHTGLAGLERMYQDRCIIMPVGECPAHCRFCFRKFYEASETRTLSFAQLDAVVNYVAQDQRLREVLITGGEPVTDPERLAYLLQGLRRISHLGPIRIACRSLVTSPDLVDRALIALLQRHQDLRQGQPIEVVLHCNHPDELSLPTIERLAQLREAGLHVCNQTVLLRQINTDAVIMLELLRQLRRYGVETYHLYFAGPVLGMDYLRPTLDEALALKTELRARATGRLIPHLIVTTRIGKIELGVDGWITEREADGRHVWLRTPYTLAGFQDIDPHFAVPEDCRIAPDDRLLVRYLDGLPLCS